MSTIIRPVLSKKNPYYISKHRYYELKHFCLQYNDWKKAYTALLYSSRTAELVRTSSKGHHSDYVGDIAVKLNEYSKNMELVEKCAKACSDEIGNYILAAVTQGKSFKYFEAKEEIPCGKDMFYDRYRRFFWLLSKEKD